MEVPSQGEAAWQVRRPLAPICNESLDGYIARAAAHNLIDNALSLTSLAGVVYGHKPLLSTHAWNGLPAVARCLRVDVDELRHRSHPLEDPTRDLRRFFGTAVEGRHLEILTRRFAPAALDISAHHRAVWRLRPFPYCTQTWQYLTDRCPRCSGIQRWYRTNGIERCDYCVEDLRRAPTAFVPADERAAASAAAGLADPDPRRRMEVLSHLPADIRALGEAGALEMLIRLLPLVDQSMPLPTGRKRRLWRAAPDRITTAIAHAWPLLTAWPSAVVELMSDKIAAAPNRYSDGNHNMSVCFLKGASYRSNPMVEEAIRQLRALVDLHGPNREELQERTLSLKAIAKRFGIGTQPLTKIRRKGGLPAEFTLEAGRAVARFDAAEVQCLQAALKTRVSFQSAAWQLGISYHGVEQLTAMGLLPALAHPYYLIRYGGPQTTATGLAELLASLQESAALREPDGLLRLRRAVHMIGGRPKPWGPIFRALLEGAIPCKITTGQERLSHRVLIHPSSLAYLETLVFEAAPVPGTAFEPCMTRHDAGETLNLQPKEYTHLLRSYGAGWNASDRIVPMDEVQRFATGLISTSEVALRLGTNSRSAYHRLRKLGMSPVIPSAWDRGTAEKLLHLTAANSADAASRRKRTQQERTSSWPAANNEIERETAR